MQINTSFSPFMVANVAGRTLRGVSATDGAGRAVQAGQENFTETKSKNSGVAAKPFFDDTEKTVPADQQGSGAEGQLSSVSANQPEQDKQPAGKAKETPLAQKKPNGEPLTSSDQKLLTELKQADMAVRAHEQAHLAAAGPYAKGAASFSYQRGPDGRDYAVGGEVQVDTSEESTPERTISKMTVVRAAALAPADPSPQDQQVAAAASSKIVEASQELQIESAGKLSKSRSDSASTDKTDGNKEAGKTNQADQAKQNKQAEGVEAGQQSTAPMAIRPKPVYVAYRRAAAGASMRPAVDIIA